MKIQMPRSPHPHGPDRSRRAVPPRRARGARAARVAGAALLALAAAAAPAPRAAAQSAQTDLTDRGQLFLFREISEALVCQCGCNMILYVCNHHNCPSATPIRKEIEAMIRAGKGKDEIVARFVSEYGEKILSAPTTTGFNLAAWVAPFVALVLGGVFVMSFLAARRRGALAASSRAAAAAPGAAPPQYAARVDDEMREIED
jgi:cytochrome c-type biogenesis protein CcmH/NrfF